MVDILICAYTLFGLNMFQSSSIVRDWSSQDPNEDSNEDSTMNTDWTKEMGPVVAYISNGGAGFTLLETVRAKELALPFYPYLASYVVGQYMTTWFYFST